MSTSHTSPGGPQPPSARLTSVQWLLVGCVVALLFIVVALLLRPNGGTPARVEQDPGRRAMALQIDGTMRRESLPVVVDTTGDRDTVLRLTSQACSSALLDALEASRPALAQQGFRRTICVSAAGETIAERDLSAPPRPQPSQATNAADLGAAVDAGADPFDTYIRARVRGGSASRAGVYVTLQDTDCSRRLLSAVGRMSDAPDLLERALRSEVEFVTCTPSSGGDATTRRWPSAGVRIPDVLGWQRRYVVTPFGRGQPSAGVWCLHDGRGGLPGALCFRDPAECVRRREEMVQLYEGLGSSAGTEAARDIQQCRITPALWCFETGGTEQQCTVLREACEDWSASMRGGGECEQRNAL